MLSALLKLRELKRLLKRGDHEPALRLARDPAIRDHRVALEGAETARAALLAEGLRLADSGQVEEGLQRVRRVLQDREDPEVRQRFQSLVQQAAAAREAGLVAAGTAARLERALAEGRLAEARDGAGALDAEAARSLLARVEAAEAAAAQHLAAARRAPDVLTAARDLGAAFATHRAASGLADGVKKTLRDLDAGAPVEAWAELEALTRGLADHDLRQKFEAQLVVAIEAGLREEGDLSAARARLELLGPGHPERTVLDRHLAQARALDEAGRRGDDEALGAAIEALEARVGKGPRTRAARRVKDDLEGVRPRLARASKVAGSGALLEARGMLLEVLEAHPEHRMARALLDDVTARERGDREVLEAARTAIALGRREEGLEGRLLALEARRSDLPEAALLRKEVALLGPEASSAPGPSTEAADALPARPRAIHFRPLPTGHAVEVPPGEPFVLRVEEHGDWLVHPGEALLLGASTGGVADLPVLAAISSRHARIDRTPEGHCLIPLDGKEVQRNFRPVKAAQVLEHGDRIRLGRSLEFIYRRPIAENRTAVLEFEGDFTVHGCRRVVLFDEGGRGGGLVLGPAPKAHVALRGAERVELFRADQGEAAGLLLGRSPKGVAVGDTAARPQTRVRAAVPIRASDLTFFLDPLGS